jgi:hypothetical protein
MKNIVVLFITILMSYTVVNAQGMAPISPPHGDHDPAKKIEELEKLRLIDVLNMDEQTTLRFFARRDKFKDGVKNLYGKEDKILDKMFTIINSDSSSKGDGELKKLVSQYLDTESQITQSRANFVNSLNDILSEDQIAKYLVFEKKFKDEIRNLLFRERLRSRH